MQWAPRESNMYKYFRMNYSGYFSNSFANLERRELESIRNLVCAESKDDAEIIITSSDTITKEIPANTKLVVHPNSGYDGFNLDWLKKGIYPLLLAHLFAKLLSPSIIFPAFSITFPLSR